MWTDFFFRQLHKRCRVTVYVLLKPRLTLNWLTVCRKSFKSFFKTHAYKRTCMWWMWNAAKTKRRSKYYIKRETLIINICETVITQREQKQCLVCVLLAFSQLYVGSIAIFALLLCERRESNAWWWSTAKRTKRHTVHSDD